MQHPSLFHSLPFTAARCLFHEAITADSLTVPVDRDQLLELAELQQEAFTLVNLQMPGCSLWNAAALQFRLVADLYDQHARPLYVISHGPDITMTLLYAEMVRRLLAHCDRDSQFLLHTAAHYLHPLGTAFDLLEHALASPLSSPADLPSITTCCADYLNFLSFVLFKADRQFLPRAPLAGKASTLPEQPPSS